MRRLLPLLALLAAPAAAADPAPSPAAVTWKKLTLDTQFRAEGVAVADVNGDGHPDVLNGEYWYAGPDFARRHEMQEPKDHGTGERGYSRVFACWADDFNGDGYPDLLVIDFPGAPCYWMENPKGKEPHWRKHPVWHSACNETPVYVDLLGTGKRVLVMGFQPKGAKPDGNDGRMAYFAPNKNDPYATWEMHPISEPSQPGKPVPGTNRFSHGLGVGDLNGDGKADVICTEGWWEQPTSADTSSPWKFHPAKLGEACADMFAVDVDGDGKADVLSTSAHKFGVWWHKQRPDPKGGESSFQTATLFGMLSSETHAAHWVDVDGDGQPDLVTGKRWWSHGRSEPGSSWPARLYWVKAVRNPDKIVSFTPYVIDEDSGVGTQFAIADVNKDGLPDVVVSNKKGVFVLLQQRK
jgi:hypothetical protein